MMYVAVGEDAIAVEAGEASIRAAIEQHFRHLLTPGSRRVLEELIADACAPDTVTARGEAPGLEPCPEAVVHQLEGRILLTLIRARRERLWLHAGGVARAGKALVIAAPSAHGKSTLVTTLVEQGWHYLSDEYVPLEIATGQVIPFPRTPWKRLDPGRELPLDRVLELRRVRVPVAPSAVARVPTPIGALLFPAYRHGAGAELRAHSPSSAALKLLSLAIHGPGTRPELLRALCGLLERLPCYELTFGDARQAADLLSAACAGWPTRVDEERGPRDGS